VKIISIFQADEQGEQIAKRRVATVINEALVEAYWTVGKYIVEFEQDGSARAKYGEQFSRLSGKRS